jgi:glutamate racemase
VIVDTVANVAEHEMTASPAPTALLGCTHYHTAI